MLARFRTSLTNPKGIGNYKNEKVLISLLYMFLLTFLAILPTLILTIKSNGVSESNKQFFRRSLVQYKEEMPVGGIVDGKLSINEPTGFCVGPVALTMSGYVIDYMTSLELTAKGIYYVADMQETKIVVSFASSKIKTFTYEELGLTNFSFDFIQINDSEGFEKLEQAYETIVNKTASFWKPVSVISSFFTLYLGILLAALLYALVSKLLVKIPYGQLFNISIFSLTPALIFILFGELFNLSFLNIIGGIIAIIYLEIALRHIDSTNRDNLEMED